MNTESLLVVFYESSVCPSAFVDFEMPAARRLWWFVYGRTSTTMADPSLHQHVWSWLWWQKQASL